MILNLPDCLGDGVDVETCSSSSLATAAAAATCSSGQLFMMNLLVHSLMDDDAGLKVAVELALKNEVQVSLLRLMSTNHTYCSLLLCVLLTGFRKTRVFLKKPNPLAFLGFIVFLLY